MSNPPIGSWLSEVLAEGSCDLFMVFWHHYSCGSYTHTSGHGIFFDLDDAIDYAVALVRRAEAEKSPIDQGVFDELENGTRASDITCNWDSRDLDIVDKSGTRIFHKVSRWRFSKEDMTARMYFECDTPELIRMDIEFDAKNRSSSA